MVFEEEVNLMILENRGGNKLGSIRRQIKVEITVKKFQIVRPLRVWTEGKKAKKGWQDS